MHAKNDQPNIPSAALEAAGDRPLAPSALSGEARLRELEHLADTARKVRDQAASELTRNSGSTHHVARERMAAAERMLRKAQQEIAQLREAQGIGGTGAPAGQQAKDFELAVMLGHSRARFNVEGGSTLSLQERPAPQRSHDIKSAAGKRGRQAPSLWRLLGFGLLIAVGIGIGSQAIHGYIETGTVDGAAQAVRTGTTHLVDRLRDLLTLPAQTGPTTRALT